MDRQGGRRLHLWWIAVVGLVVAAATAMGASAPAVDGSATGSDTPVVAVQVTCSAPAWNAAAFYDQGAVVSHRGRQWRANHGMWPGLEPGVAGTPPYWVPWADLGACSSGTTTTAPSTTSTTGPGSTTTTTAPSGQSVEDHFGARGPWPVTTQPVTVPGATTGPVLLFHPTNLGADGVDHPILTSAAGTGWTVQPDDELANHLASWGYVVAGISSPGAGADAAEADSMRAAARWLVGQNTTSGSVFAGKLDTTAIGALGHSQGAGATMLLMGSSRNADGLFSSAAPLALPDRIFWAGGINPDLGLVDEPIMFFSGTSDFLTSPGEQTFFFNQVRGPAAKAAAVGRDHNGMIAASVSYLTAWFEYTLGGDQFARRAFVGSPPQISTNSAWTNWAAKSLP
jgi:hypothetical protein